MYGRMHMHTSVCLSVCQSISSVLPNDTACLNRRWLRQNSPALAMKRSPSKSKWMLSWQTSDSSWTTRGARTAWSTSSWMLKCRRVPGLSSRVSTTHRRSQTSQTSRLQTQLAAAADKAEAASAAAAQRAQRQQQRIENVLSERDAAVGSVKVSLGVLCLPDQAVYCAAGDLHFGFGEQAESCC